MRVVVLTESEVVACALGVQTLTLGCCAVLGHELEDAARVVLEQQLLSRAAAAVEDLLDLLSAGRRLQTLEVEAIQRVGVGDDLVMRLGRATLLAKDGAISPTEDCRLSLLGRLRLLHPGTLAVGLTRRGGGGGGLLGGGVAGMFEWKRQRAC